MPTPRKHKIRKPREKIKGTSVIPVREKATKAPHKSDAKKKGNKPGSNGGGGKRNAKIFDEETLQQVESLASSGLSTTQIGAYYGISHSGVYTLQNRFPPLKLAIAKGRAIGIASVAQKLRQEAEAGNMQAAIFYLKAKGGWSEKVQIDITAKVEIEAATIQRIESLSPEQRSVRLKELDDLRNLENQVIDVEVV